MHIFRFAGVVALLGSLAPAIANEPNSGALVYSPWTKMCLLDQENKGPCFIGRDARLECGLHIVSAFLIEDERTASKTLRLAVPHTVDKDSGIRVAIDQRQFTTRPYTHGDNTRRTAEYEMDANLINQLKQGQMLIVEVTDPAAGAVTLKLPLAGFAQAYDGPPLPTPKVREEILSSEKMQEPRRQSEEDARKRAEFLARAYRSGWPRCD